MRNTVAIVVAALALGLATGCPDKDHNESVQRFNQGIKAFRENQFATAVNEFDEALRLEKENHPAHYYKAFALLKQENYEEAVKSFAEAVRIKDDDAMYRMYYGVALYEQAIDKAKKDSAAKLQKKVTDLSGRDVDLSGVNFDTALQQLEAAVKLNGELYRAHYTIGRIHRELEDSQKAAESFTRALQANPRFALAYVALGNMYVDWDFADQAIQVLKQGVANVPGETERSDIFYALGMALDIKSQRKEAIEAYTKALEDRKDNHKAKFQRGMDYFLEGDLTAAKEDLTQFSKAGGAKEEFAKSMANKTLMDIAMKQM